ncbi:hypothetical protein ACWD00_25350 [Streptomyces viridiviolaceus]
MGVEQGAEPWSQRLVQVRPDAVHAVSSFRDQRGGLDGQACGRRTRPVRGHRPGLLR